MLHSFPTLRSSALHGATGNDCPFPVYLSPDLIGTVNLHVVIPQTLDSGHQNIVLFGSLTAQLRIAPPKSEEHTSELQSLMRSSYAYFCLKKKKKQTISTTILPLEHT